MMTMTDLLPAVLWLFAVVWSITVCVIAVIRARLLSFGVQRPAVEPVTWNVIYAQVASVVLGSVPFCVFLFFEDEFGDRAAELYRTMTLPGAAIILTLIVAEWVLLFVQAKRAERTQMDRVLARGSDRH